MPASLQEISKETERKWEEGDDISLLESKTTEYGRSKKVIATEEIKQRILEIGINKCVRESGFDRKNFVRKVIRGIPVKRNSYNEFVRWLPCYKSRPATVCGDFAEGLSRWKFGKKYGFIDRLGKVVIEPKFDLTFHFSEGLGYSGEGER